MVGIIPTTINGVPGDKAYIPIPGIQAVGVINAGAPAHTPPLAVIPMPPGFTPTATAANPKTYTVVVAIDANTDTVGPSFTLPISGSYLFSGGACTVCGMVVDSVLNQAVFATVNGYYVVDLASFAVIRTVVINPAENFGYNPFTRQIISPYYTKFENGFNYYGVQLSTLSDGAVYDFSGFAGDVPDAAALDYSTFVAAIPNEPFTSSITTGYITFINLNAETLGTASFSAPATSFSMPDTSGICSGSSVDEQNEWTMAAVESTTHSLFLAAEFSNCAAVLDMPPLPSLGPPSVASTLKLGAMPTSPDGQGWFNGYDPHGIGAFVSAVDGRAYGFLVRGDGYYVARMDLVNLLGAQTLSGSQYQVDLSPLVVFLPTVPNLP